MDKRLESHGEVCVAVDGDGTKLILEQEAYCDNYLDGSAFFAIARTKDGSRRFMIRWRIDNPDAEYSEVCCDWDDPEHWEEL